LAQDYPDFEIIVVDNGSTDGSADFVAERYPQVRLIRNERNLGFAAGNNVGLRAATGDVLVLLNQDTVVQAGWLAALTEALQKYPDVGVVGAKVLNMDGHTLQHAGGYIEPDLALGQHYGHGEMDRGQYNNARQVEFVTGAAMAFKREVLSKVGELDEGFFPGYFEDVDFCYRAREANYTVWYAPQAVLYHHESASMREDSYRGHCYYYRNRLRFVLKHYSLPRITRFIQAETERVELISTEELRAAALATVEGMLLWPLLAWQRKSPLTQTECETVLSELRALQSEILRGEEQISQELAASYEEAQGTEVEPERSQSCREVSIAKKDYQGTELTLAKGGKSVEDDAAQQEKTSVFESIVSRLPNYNGGSEITELFSSDLHRQLQRETQSLNQQWEVTPQPFESDVAVLGPLIVAFRSFVNDLSTRWYVQALLDQQVSFNANVVRLLNAQAAEFETRVRQNVQTLHELTLQHIGVLSKIAHVAEAHDTRLQHHDASLEYDSQRIYDQAQSTTVLTERIAKLEWQLLSLKNRVSELEEELRGH
jgi:GT2 family glycosyltransferase